MTTGKPLPGDKRRPESMDAGRRVLPASDVRQDDVLDLIRQADSHELGRTFLESGAQDSVAATFGVHAFIVDAARQHLARD